MLHKLLILLAITLASGCTTTKYITQPLERPARPVLPNLQIDQAQKIPQNTWNILITRHRMMRQYAEKLEVIIDGTKGEK